MPYLNSYNKRIAEKIKSNEKKFIKDMDNIEGAGRSAGVKSYIKKIKSTMDGGAILGGSLYSRPIGGAKHKTRMSAKGMSAGGMSAGGMSAGGMSAGGMSAGSIYRNRMLAKGMSAGAKCPHCKGSGFWSDFGEGFMKGIKGVAKVASVLPIPAIGPVMRAGLGALGGAKCSKCMHKKKSCSKCLLGHGKLVDVSNMKGVSGGAKSRSKRGEIVKKIMKERGVSLPVASSIVKREGLY